MACHTWEPVVRSTSQTLLPTAPSRRRVIEPRTMNLHRLESMLIPSPNVETPSTSIMRLFLPMWMGSRQVQGVRSWAVNLWRRLQNERMQDTLQKDSGPSFYYCMFGESFVLITIKRLAFVLWSNLFPTRIGDFLSLIMNSLTTHAYLFSLFNQFVSWVSHQKPCAKCIKSLDVPVSRHINIAFSQFLVSWWHTSHLRSPGLFSFSRPWYSFPKSLDESGVFQVSLYLWINTYILPYQNKLSRSYFHTPFQSYPILVLADNSFDERI